VRDDRRRLPAELVVRKVAEAGVPLRAVAVEAEEVRSADLQGRVLRAGRTVDKRLRRVLLRVVGDRDRLVARERADQDVGFHLLLRPLRLRDRLVGRGVTAAYADELKLMTVDRGADPPLARLVRVLW